MEKKICPLLLAAMMIGPVNNSPDTLKKAARCIGHECQWWTRSYTPEGISYPGCAVEINALANSRVAPGLSRGEIPV